MRIALLQLNPTVGALEANAQLVRTSAEEALGQGAQLVATPELALCGYPPRDLLLQEGFVDACVREARALAEAWRHAAPLVVGTPWREGQARPHNALVVCRSGGIERVYAKRLLPTYDVFDEHRYFVPGDEPCVIEAGGLRVGLAICEDAWRGDDVAALDADPAAHYRDRPDPIAELIEAGAECVVLPSASPFALGKGQRQRRILQGHAQRFGVPVAAVNQVGANDDLIFDGHAAVYAPREGSEPALIAAAPGFVEHTLCVDIKATNNTVADPMNDADPMQHLWQALVMGVRDYCGKCGIPRTVLGISGGIDSAVVATVASAAMGAENVIGLAMPSRYSSGHSVDDAIDLAQRLGIAHTTLPIAPMHDPAEAMLTPAFADLGLPAAPDVTEENIQSRIRGTIVMAFANKAGAIALTTGNKSELAVGYCTLYGDMNGGLAVLSDVRKVDVFALARWCNEHHQAIGFDAPPIPENTIEKPPSAELRPDQLDSDSLPPYEVLDTIIERYVERCESAARIIDETGYEPELVLKMLRMIDLNEHKRKQMPIGIKVSSVAFGRGRRRPLAQRYRHSR